MPRAIDLIRQDRREELWQMCCGWLSFSTEQFMAVQNRLLLEQIELLRHSQIGKKVLNSASVRNVDDFRRRVPLTTYADYAPELSEKREDALPVKPAFWVHSSGRSGEYPCKWIPITPRFADEMSTVMYGIGILSGCDGWGDVSHLMENPRIVYTVAPRPYMSGAMASMLGLQSPVDYLPGLDESESLSFEDRIKLGFKMALSEGLDYFFGLSLVLVTVGNKFSQSTQKVDLRPFLRQPKALLRLAKGVLKSKLAGRHMLPRDLWSVKGILCGGLDSWVYKEKIKELWGRYPLDVYAGTEGGIYAAQTWDYEGMTFVPSLNFLEFIPEKEHFKWQLDRTYQPQTILLDEVKAGENYEVVLTNFHGGAMVRYRPGDMVRITSRRNEKLGIEIPQMVFERRADGLIDFVFIRLTEKSIWQAIESSGLDYEDWTAYKKPGEPVLSVCIEIKNGENAGKEAVARAIHDQIIRSDSENKDTQYLIRDDFADMIDFKVEVNLLPKGTYAGYMAQRQAEGADLAHLKPPHINPSPKVLSLLLGKPEAIPAVKTAVEREPVSVP